MTRSLLFLAAALVSLAVAATRADADSVDTFQVNGTYLVQFERVDCVAGIPATTNCFHNVSLRAGVFPGVGEVGPGAYTLVWDDFGAPCAHVQAQIPLLVAGKGEIDLAMSFTACFVADLFPPAAVTVTGGTGRYAGASGSGMLTFSPPTLTGPGAGNRVIAWTGTLNVPGLTFDTTPPEIAGATSKVVKTRLRAGARARYAVSASDATDGPLPAACLPRSGSLFPVGRTTVTCSPVDSSGNATRAHFVITVKRVRR
jgi:hypothetical protein